MIYVVQLPLPVQQQNDQVHKVQFFFGEIQKLGDPQKFPKSVLPSLVLLLSSILPSAAG